MKTTYYYITFIQFILLSSIHSTSNKDWSDAPRSILAKKYHPYELCLLDNAESVTPQKTIFDQDICRPFIDERLNQINKRCWMGGIQQHLDFGLCFREGCHSLQDRIGLKKYWSHLYPTTISSFDIFLSSIINSGFKIAR